MQDEQQLGSLQGTTFQLNPQRIAHHVCVACVVAIHPLHCVQASWTGIWWPKQTL
jgi:hypothetical protein